MILVLGISLAACDAVDENPLTELQEDVDATAVPAHVQRWSSPSLHGQLRSLLATQAPFGGLTFYRLPDSDQLHKIPQDPKNRLTADKVRLGQLLYHETALAVNNVYESAVETYSCASCHFAQAGFQANLPQGIAEGGSGFGVAGEARVM